MALHVVIVGAGPSGLAAALSLSLSKLALDPPQPHIRITVLERRLQNTDLALGGAVNLTPLALRYLDSLGVGKNLRASAAQVDGIDLIAHRTGKLLGKLWGGLDTIRVQRRCIVDEMTRAIDVLRTQQGASVRVVYGASVQTVEEHGEADDGNDGSVRITFTQSSDRATEPESIEADVLLGCDGIHSQIRSLIVDRSRTKQYSGKCIAYSYIPISSTKHDEPQPTGTTMTTTATATPPSAADTEQWRRADGAPLIAGTSMLMRGNNSLLMTHHEASRKSLYLVAVMPVEDAESRKHPNKQTEADAETASREGWAVRGGDKTRIKHDIQQTFAGSALPCVDELLGRAEEWFLYPVYSLPPGGAWSKGRTLLLGDAAHAMPPQGESTGIAIEDAILLAHIFTRRSARSIPQLFSDYETLRRPDINRLYSESVARWNSPVRSRGWLAEVAAEWAVWAYVMYMNRQQTNFERDVRKLDLPT